MREILFRGKSVDKNVGCKWVYGGILTTILGEKSSRADIVQFDKAYGAFVNIRVNERTIGQSTGLTDKNGVKIFEGDIVKGTALSRDRIGVIVWIDEIAGFGVRYVERNGPTAWEESSILKNIARCNYSDFVAEVIGNIFDNPELLQP